MRSWEVVIGLEVHAQLLTQTKIFCSVASSFGKEENTSVGPVSGGLPGSLPVLNRSVVELAVRAGLALNCEIHKKSVFARKHYFYPDLPKGFQISQYDQPICGPGWIDIQLESNRPKKIHLERIHLEEDAGKSVHIGSMSLVNLNRSGVPLIEIVSRPDMRSPQEAGAYLRKLHAILVFAGVTDGNLEEGNFRCDANVSVRPLGETKLGTRTELKNINSFRFVEKAIDYEMARQIALIEGGGIVVQETRGWDSSSGKTFTMRKKEEAHDYRYFPEPDLPPLLLEDSWIESIRSKMPELPEQKKSRLIREYGLNLLDAESLTSSRDLCAYFESVVNLGANPKLSANWISSELLRALKEFDGNVQKSPISAQRLAELVQLIEDGTISGKIAKSVFERMLDHPEMPREIIRSLGLVQISDVMTVEQWAQDVVNLHPDQVSEFRSGKEKVLGFFVGEIMKRSRGQANPKVVNEVLRRVLK